MLAEVAPLGQKIFNYDFVRISRTDLPSPKGALLALKRLHVEMNAVDVHLETFSAGEALTALLAPESAIQVFFDLGNVDV